MQRPRQGPKTRGRREFGASEQWKAAAVNDRRPRWHLVPLQHQQEATAGLLGVVVLFWFSGPGGNTVICISDSLPWLRGREWMEGSGRGIRQVFRRLAVHQGERRWWWGPGGHPEDDEKRSDSRSISEEQGACGLYCVSQKYMFKCYPTIPVTMIAFAESLQIQAR